MAWFPGFVSVLSAPKGREGSVEELLGDLLTWAVANLSAQERKSVADAIDDPALTFVSTFVASKVRELAATLSP